MADKIKKFFEKKKVEHKFKKLGPGRKLNASEAAASSSSSNTRPDNPTPKPIPSGDPLSPAAAAALARLDDKNKKHSHFNTSQFAIQAQVKRELEALSLSTTSSTNTDEKIIKKPDIDPSFMIVSGVYFKCPIIGSEILPKNEWTAKIKKFLYDQLEEEPLLISCLIIRTCNKNKEKVELGVETLCKILENVMNHPDEEKFRRIRVSNRAFSERVASLEGSRELLTSAGFILTTENEEDYYIYNKECAYSEDALPILLDALRTSTSIRLELDRNLQVLLPSHIANRNELPPDFFNLKLEELKAEQQNKIDQVQKNMELRTRAMRERDEIRQMKKYKYAVIRIRFPDNLFLQGTFSVYEQFEEILNFLNENIIDDCPSYSLLAPNGQFLNEENANTSLLDLGLVPATILIFAVNSKEGAKEEKENKYLKPEVMLLCQTL